MSSPITFSAARLERDSARPLYRQIYDLIRADILDQRITRGRRLAATRVLAEDLGVSRTTVLEAVEQLVAEGYLTARVGAGTFVAEDLPEAPLVPLDASALTDETRRPRLSQRGEAIRRAASKSLALRGRPFRPGPEVDLFPWATWRRLAARCARDGLPRSIEDADGRGHRPLREQLAQRLWETRGIACSVDQILIVRGSQQGLELAARVLLDEGDEAWCEDPCYHGARRAFETAGVRLVPIPVDQEGLVVTEGIERSPAARLACVTPSHHYPLGMTLTARRRLELLEWARRNGAWIVEDDYDSGYRYDGRPLASLASLDDGRHVVYVGTFSRVLFPALRLGYLVAPAEHVDAFVKARCAADPGSVAFEHLVVADFLAEGHVDRHARRMRRLYQHRQQCLVDAIRGGLGAEVEVHPSPAGLHLIGWLRRSHDEAELVRHAACAGIHVEGVSSFCLQARLPAGVLLGYASYTDDEIRDGVDSLMQAVAGLDSSAGGRSRGRPRSESLGRSVR